MTEAYTPDLTGISVCIATPSHDGKYEGRFMASLYRTFLEIKRLGGNGDFFHFQYCADIALARAKIFGQFYRSSHTHLLWVDSDQGWKAEDVIRLILLDREFIGGVSVKKEYPLKFAVNFIDENNNPLPVLEEVNTGVVHVNEVGLAFMLMKRAVADKMVEAYPELQFDGDGNNTEYAVFDSMITNRRRRSEDFSFCKRWTNIGGKIQLLSDIELTHTGPHTFRGKFSEALKGEGWSASEPTRREYLRHDVEKTEN